MRNMKNKSEGINMTTLAKRAGNDIKEMAAILAAYPSPDKWTKTQKDQAVQFAALLDTAHKMIIAKSIIGINIKLEINKFLNSAGRTQSKHTQIAYKSSLDRLSVWADRQKLNILELSSAQADDFI